MLLFFYSELSYFTQPLLLVPGLLILLRVSVLVWLIFWGKNWVYLGNQGRFFLFGVIWRIQCIGNQHTFNKIFQFVQYLTYHFWYVRLFILHKMLYTRQSITLKCLTPINRRFFLTIFIEMREFYHFIFFPFFPDI